MRRREFLGVFGAAATWPLATHAQPSERTRRIAVLLPATADDAEYQTLVGAFLQALAQLGWTIGHNVRIDTRWATTDAAQICKHAAELAALAPDVILALTKVGVASGAPDGSTWGSELVGYAELSTGFAASLAPWSAYACAAQDQDLNCIKRSDVMAIKELIAGRRAEETSEKLFQPPSEFNECSRVNKRKINK